MAADEVMRVEQRHVFVQFHVLLDAQLAVMRLHAEFVHGTLLRAATARTRSKMLSARARARNGVDDDVGLGQRAVHGFSGGAHQFAGVLECECAWQRKGEVGKIMRPRSDARAPVLPPALREPAPLRGRPAAAFRRGSDPSSTPTVSRVSVQRDAQDHQRNNDGCDGIGVAQPANVEVRAQPTGAAVRPAQRERTRCPKRSETHRWPAPASRFARPPRAVAAIASSPPRSK